MSEARLQSEGRKGRKPSSEKRRALIEAAARLFAERGVDAATTREVALRAGATERTLFKHFGSKDGLVKAVVETASADMAREAVFGRILSDEPFARAEFTAWHRAFVADGLALAQARPERRRILFRELFRDPDFAAGFAAQWTRRALAPLTRHLARMQASGEIAAAVPPETLAAALFGLYASYLAARFALAPAAGWSDARDVEALAELAEALLGPGGRAPPGSRPASNPSAAG